MTDKDLFKIATAFGIALVLALISPFLPLIGMVTIVPWLIWKSFKKN